MQTDKLMTWISVSASCKFAVSGELRMFKNILKFTTKMFQLGLSLNRYFELNISLKRKEGEGLNFFVQKCFC